MERPWVSEQWNSSPYNYAPGARDGLHFPSNITVADCTMREGDQCAGVVLNKGEKVRIAHALDELGIHEIEVGMPAVSPEERDTAKTLLKEGLKARLTVLCRARKDDIDMAAEIGAHWVNISLPSGYLQIEYRLRWPQQRVIDTALEITRYARQKGLSVTLSPYDTTRSDITFLQQYLSAVLSEGNVDRVRLVDTAGSVAPHGIVHLVGAMRQVTQLPIEVHCHNDFGLAVANTLAALAAGANVISSSFNGIGERAGNTPTEEIALALRVLYGIDLGLDLEKVYQTSCLIQELTGMKLQPHKPVVGENAFTQISGLVIDGFRANPYVALSYLPDLVGRHSTVALGKATGRSSIEFKLKELGLTANEEQVRKLVSAVKEESQNRKADILDEEFRAIVKRICQS